MYYFKYKKLYQQNKNILVLQFQYFDILYYVFKRVRTCIDKNAEITHCCFALKQLIILELATFLTYCSFSSKTNKQKKNINHIHNNDSHVGY